jgi:hypothetical protein
MAAAVSRSDYHGDSVQQHLTAAGCSKAADV